MADIAGIVSPIAPSVQQSKFNSDMQIMKEVFACKVVYSVSSAPVIGLCQVLTQLEPSDLTAIKDDFAMYTDKREPGVCVCVCGCSCIPVMRGCVFPVVLGATDVSVEAFVAIVWQHIHRALTFTAQQTSPLKKDFKYIAWFKLLKGV